MHPKDVGGMAKSVDTDQTAPLGVDLCLHGLLRPICPATSNFYLNSVFFFFFYSLQISMWK